MQKIFVSGIDTNIGKTVAAGWLARNFMAQGKSVITQKLIQTGCVGISEDILAHRKIMGAGILPEDSDSTTCKYVLRFPSSPHLACRLENVKLDLRSIAENTEKLARKFDVVIIEGAGGLMVPLTEDVLTSDYIKENDLQVALVVSSRLGSLNHALLSLEYCLKKPLKLYGIVYNTYPKADKEIEDSTRDYLKAYLEKNFPGAKFLEMGKLEF